MPGFDIAKWSLDNLTNVRPSTGVELEAECPWCRKTGHFYINGETGDHICFKCGAKGRGPVGVVAQVEGLTYLEAERFVFRKAVQFKRRKETPRTVREKIEALRPEVERPEVPEVEVDLPEEFIPIWDGRRWRMPTYLLERGVTRRAAKFWGLGFCETGRYSGRIIIPIDCPNGRSFTARDTTGFREPKYLNPVGSDHRRLIYGWDQAGTDGDVILVEGPTDVWGVTKEGLLSVGLFGKRLHPEQLNLLCRWPSDRVLYIMMDPDAQVEAVHIARALRVKFRNLFLCSLPKGTDPGSAGGPLLRRTLLEGRPFIGGRLEIVKIFLDRSRGSG